MTNWPIFENLSITGDKLDEFTNTEWLTVKAQLTFCEAKLRCKTENSTLISLENDSIDRYLNYTVSDWLLFQKYLLPKSDYNFTEECMWTGGFFDLSDNPYELLWENGSGGGVIKSLYSKDELEKKFCNSSITELIDQKLQI